MTLVTGGGSGIGAATAAVLRAGGGEVVICGRRRDALEAVAATTGAMPVVADASEPASMATAIVETVEHFGRLDGLVASHGIGRGGTVEAMDPSDWHEVLEVNLTGAYLAVRAALPELLQAGGAIVLVSSVAALRTPRASIAYNVSKAGLVALGRSLAVDHGPQGLRANVVCPGWTRSELADREMDALAALEDGDRAHAYALTTALVPQRRAAEASEIAAAIAWLLSPAASYVNGAVVAVDGGLTSVDPGTVAMDFQVSPRSPR